ncbi:MAG: hypothetical protein HRU13_04510 [Phycisphaerales bacterium]|nr:hypothetical protein [Phycisphaerales bacterium]
MARTRNPQPRLLTDQRRASVDRKLVVLAVFLMSLAGVAATAQHALDMNLRYSSQLGSNMRPHGFATYNRSTSFGARNRYVPGVRVRSSSPYTINRTTGTYTFNPNQGFGRPAYRPTGYGVAGGSQAYQRRFRYR